MFNFFPEKQPNEDTKGGSTARGDQEDDPKSDVKGGSKPDASAPKGRKTDEGTKGESDSKSKSPRFNPRPSSKRNSKLKLD